MWIISQRALSDYFIKRETRRCGEGGSGGIFVQKLNLNHEFISRMAVSDENKISYINESAGAWLYLSYFIHEYSNFNEFASVTDTGLLGLIQLIVVNEEFVSRLSACFDVANIRLFKKKEKLSGKSYYWSFSKRVNMHGKSICRNICKICRKKALQQLQRVYLVLWALGTEKNILHL